MAVWTKAAAPEESGPRNLLSKRAVQMHEPEFAFRACAAITAAAFILTLSKLHAYSGCNIEASKHS